MDHIDRYLQHEWFLPGARVTSKRRIHFPYLYTLPYALSYARIYRGLSYRFFNDGPWFDEFYDDNHPSGARPLTVAILENFEKEAQQRGKAPVILIVPTSRDIYYYATHGTWTYASLMRQLTGDDIPYYNVGDYIARSLGNSKLSERQFLCSYFCTEKATQSGHYTETGHLLLSKIVHNIVCDVHRKDGKDEPEWPGFSCPG